MSPFHQLCWIFLWILSVICVLCGTAQACSLQTFMQSSYFDEHFDVSGLSQSYDLGATVRVPCVTGFRSFFKLICADQGWTYLGEKCKPIECGHPGDVLFADFALVHGDDFVFGSQVLYTCHPGYQMTSISGTRNCLPGGWDGHLPVCEPVTCPSLTVTRNVVVNGDLDQAQSGSVVKFRCSSEEELEGPAQIVCRDNGKWDNEPPICRAIICPKPPLDNFVLEGEKAEYKKNDVLKYKCNNKYKKVDGRPSTCDKVGGSGQWSPPPRCELKTCKVSADRVDGTSYSPENQLIFTPGESVTATCTERMWVKSREFQTAQITCLDTGKWNFSPVCKLVTCHKQDENVYWWGRKGYYYSHTSEIDESVGYRCTHGFEETVPSKTATCTREGWEPNPLCKEKRCPMPSVTNAEITYYQKERYEHNDRVYFRCTYEHSVTFLMYCNSGEWTGSTQPTLPCREKPCETQPEIEDGVMIAGVQKAVYEHNENLQFKCPDETYFEVTCLSGVWNGPKSCRDQSCPKPVIKNGEFLGPDLEKFDHNGKAEVRCTGSQEKVSIICQSGNWTQVPLCPERSACGNPDIDNGFWVLHKNKVYYRCNAGYKLVSKGLWGVAECVDGKWNTSDCIAATECGPVPHIPHLQSSDRKSFQNEEKFTILCKEGHHPTLEALTCNQGKWDLNDVQLSKVCTATETKCKTPSAIKNAVIMAPVKKEYLSTTTLNYKCQDEEGQSTIRCNNGTWHPDPRNITCGNPRACKTPPALENGDFFASTTEFEHNTRVEYQCQSKYTMEGGPYKTCRNGEWMGEITCLKPCTVNEDLMEPNKVEFRWRSTDKLYALHKGNITFQCVGEAVHDGVVNLRQQCINGKIELPRCV